jgi:hypothetical protein
MTEVPTTPSDRDRSRDSRRTGGASSSSAAPTSTTPKTSFGDPVRRPIGDKPEDESKIDDRSKADDASHPASISGSAARSQTEGGEGHAGPKVDATRVAVDRSSSRPKNAAIPSAPQADTHAKSEGACSSSLDETKPMPVETQHGAAKKI